LSVYAARSHPTIEAVPSQAVPSSDHNGPLTISWSGRFAPIADCSSAAWFAAGSDPP
jgi:hypothetical protein